MSRYGVVKEPCPSCGSKDNLARYPDGHAYCFGSGCSYFEKSSSTGGKMEEIKKEPLATFRTGDAWTYGERGIDPDVASFYGATMDATHHYYPLYSNDGRGTRTATKVRNTIEKDFFSEGSLSESGLFGQNKFSAGGKRLIITEGELDAMSAYELMDRKFPVVSLRTGSKSAAKDMKDNFEFIDSFAEVFLCFDSDEPGKLAAQEAANILTSGRVRIMTPAKHKDANDYLIAGDRKEFQVELWRSETYTPAGIVAGTDLWEELSNPVKVESVPYPWEGLNELTYGIRMAEVVTIAAGSGLGKSSIIRELMYYLLKNTRKRIGTMMLEETPAITGERLMSLEANQPLHLPDATYTPTEYEGWYSETVGCGSLFMFDGFGSTDIDNILARTRYFAKALDCKYIILDHVSIVVSAQQNGDERKALDEIMTKLRTIVQELNISLFIVSHLKRPEGKGHEEGAVTSMGQLRGSAAIGQLSDIVIGLERNGQADDEVVRNTTKVRVLKNRFSGLTGVAGHLFYDKVSGRLTEIEVEEEGSEFA